ncbi:hypothetical protein [Rubrivirga sp.]|uniref:hypothetical protein n=1 Tax=Rubrivirga sp. TaxID=1885344 RepID=UPI003C70CB35
MTLSVDSLRMLVAKSLATSDEETSCGECDLEVDRFAEMTLAGLDAAEALPIVEEHLAGCPCCREEYEALLDALRAAERADQAWWRRWRSRSR